MTWWSNRSWDRSAAEGTNRYDVGRIDDRQIVGRYLSWDTATKDGEENSYTACVEAELTADYRIIIRDVWKDRLQVPFLADKVRERAAAANRDGKLQAVIIEDKSSGTGILQTISMAGDRLASKLAAFRPSGDKVQRAGQAAVWCKRGSVLLPFPDATVPWLHQFERDLGQFPDIVHDDAVDAFSQLVIYLEHILATGWRSRSDIR
jgi:predicted phage terminase large subunit-like protein